MILQVGYHIAQRVTSLKKRSLRGVNRMTNKVNCTTNGLENVRYRSNNNDWLCKSSPINRRHRI